MTPMATIRHWLSGTRAGRYSAETERRRPPERRVIPRVEGLEERTAPAVFAVSGRLSLAVLDQAAPGAGLGRSVVFIESSVAGADALVHGLNPGVDGVLLDASGDGAAEISTFLSGRRGLTSVGLVSHGSAGQVSLGTTAFDVTTLSAVAPAIRAAVRPGGEFDLWSCDVAATAAGSAFVGDLEAATGARVAASTHLIGSAAAGGSWTLDAGQAAGAAAPFAAPALSSFRGSLEGTWAAGSSLNHIRSFHDATALSDGRVLITGGDDGSAFLNTAEIYDPVPGVWSTAASMSAVREYHTATLLPNGKVLVVGGQGVGGALKSAEIYDPVVNQWTSTAAMPGPRQNHTATLLPNGKVLIAGGYDGASTVATAVIFDPIAGTWTSAGTMSSVRESQIATVLPNGKVLVAGGSNSHSASFPLATADLYDPTTNTWSAAASMAAARYDFTSSNLHNGKVLVTGGGGASAELYDCVTNTWSSAGAMSVARTLNTMTLLGNGKVLVTGGLGGSTYASAELYDAATNSWTSAGSMATARADQTATLLPNGQVIVAGGRPTGTPTASTELFSDPVATTPWHAAAPLATARYGNTSTVLGDGTILVVGGTDNAGGTLASAERYDPVSGAWSSAGSMVAARTGHTATLLPDGRVLVTGGSGSGGPTASAELYDPATNTWSPVAAMSTGRESQSATLLPDGTVLVAGGIGGGFLSSAERYDPATNTWSSAGGMSTARFNQSAVLLGNGKVLVAGGSNGSTVASADLYDPVTNSWSTAGSMSAPREFFTLTLLGNGKALAAAGDVNATVENSADIYDPTSNTWSAAAALAGARSSQAATLLPDGRVLVTGGNAGAALATTEIYDPVAKTWTSGGNMLSARWVHASALLPNGSVLVIGGEQASGTAIAASEVFGGAPILGPLSVTAWTANGPAFTGTISIVGDGPFTLVGQSGVPVGLTPVVSGSTVSFTGSPTAAGAFPFTLTVQDSVGNQTTGNFTLIVNPPLSLGPLSQTQWTANQGGFVGTIPVSLGTVPLTLQSQSGLPAGLVVSVPGPTIIITGTPTTPGTYPSVMLTVADATGASITQTYTITINPALGFAPPILPAGTYNVGYNQTIAVTGGTTPFTSLTVTGFNGGTTGLTAGNVTTNVATGIITINGTPTNSGTVTFTASVTDSAGATQTLPYTITINAAATATAAANAAVSFSASNQSVTLTAIVTSPSGPVNEGTVTFTVLQGATVIGTPVTSGTVSGGTAGVTYILPGGTVAGLYTIQAVYNPAAPTPRFLTTSDSTHTLTVGPAVSTTIAANKAVTFSATAQPVTLTATVTSSAGPVNEGTITFTVLQGATVIGTPVTSATVSGGAAAVVYTLPAGQAAGTYTISATYNPGPDFTASADSAHTLTVNGTITSSPSTLPFGTAGALYSQVITVSGGTLPYTSITVVPFNAGGTGLSAPTVNLVAGTVTFNSTPTAAGTVTFTVNASDSGSGTLTQNYSVTINPAVTLGALSVTQWTQNVAGYSAAIAVSGGTAPYSNPPTMGLPAGLAAVLVGSTITITGTPTVAGTFTPIVSIHDAAGAVVNQPYTLVINPPVSLGALSNSTFQVGQSGSATIAITNGTPGYANLTITGGALPAGLLPALIGSQVTFSGIPSQAGTFTFTVNVLDSVGATGARTYTVTVAPPIIAIDPTALPADTAGQGYTQTRLASGGSGGYTYAITGGSLPAGLILTAAGTITGTPNIAGTYAFTITATDSTDTGTGAPFQGSRAFTLTVGPATATQLVFGGVPASITAGVASGITVTALDGFGNIATGFSGQVSVVAASGPGALLGPAVVTAVNGVANFGSLGFTLVGTYQLQATASSLGPVLSTQITVLPAAATSLVAAAAPPAALNTGTPFSVTYTARDPFGNIDTNFNAAVTVSAVVGPAGDLNGTTTSTAAGGSVTYGGLTFDAPGTYQIKAAAGTVVSGFSPAVSVALAVTNTNDAGPGSLRQAILYVDSQPAPATIPFAIPASGVQTISLQSPLPALTTSTVVAGDTQPGAAANGSATGDNATLLIVLDGTSAGPTSNGLTLDAKSEVRGLVITGFATGIVVNAGAAGSLIHGTFIGVRANGQAAGNGVGIRLGAAGVTVGGAAADDRNLISGNGGDGLVDTLGGNTILGNMIGVSATGTAPLGNAGAGVALRPSGPTWATDVIGTAGAGANEIAANTAAGIEALAGTTAVITGNAIGTDLTGTIALGNAGDGVRLDGSSGSSVQSNTIAFNPIGVVVTAPAAGTGVGDTILGNSIFANTRLGIDLGDDGVTPYGSDGPAPNHFQSPPLLTGLAAGAVTGRLTALPSTAYRLEFFSSPLSGPHRQGKTFLTALTVTTNSTGTTDFTAPVGTVAADQVVTATATNGATGDTSEFSAGPISASIQGGGQYTTVNFGFIHPLTVSVTDPYGDGVAGVPVLFAGPVDKVTLLFSTGANVVTVRTNSAGAAVSPTFVASTKAGTFTATATVDGVTALTDRFGLTVTLTNVAADTVGLDVSGFPSPTLVGSVQTFLVSAVDRFGNVTPGYRGRIHLTSPDSTALLPADYTFNDQDLGTHTFQAEFLRSGVKQILAADTVVSRFIGLETGIVINATINGAGLWFVPYAGLPFTGTVGTFHTSVVGKFKAVVDWGDGTPLDAASTAVAGDASGNFTVTGTHTYATDGTFPVVVQVLNTLDGTSQSLTSTAVVLAAIQGGQLVDAGLDRSAPGVTQLVVQTVEIGGTLLLAAARPSAAPATLFAAVYGDNPTPAQPTLAVAPGAAYYDLRVTNVGAGDSLISQFSFDPSGGAKVALEYFDPASGQYRLVVPSAGGSSVVDVAHRVIQVVFDRTSVPALVHITHTVFAVVVLPPDVPDRVTPGPVAPQPSPEVVSTDPFLGIPEPAPVAFVQTNPVSLSVSALGSTELATNRASLNGFQVTNSGDDEASAGTDVGAAVDEFLTSSDQYWMRDPELPTNVGGPLTAPAAPATPAPARPTPAAGQSERPPADQPPAEAPAKSARLPASRPAGEGRDDISHRSADEAFVPAETVGLWMDRHPDELFLARSLAVFTTGLYPGIALGFAEPEPARRRAVPPSIR